MLRRRFLVAFAAFIALAAAGGLISAAGATDRFIVVGSTTSTQDSGLFGWLLSSLGQQLGYPVPEGGAGELTAALVRRLSDRGAEVSCGAEVTEIVLRGGRATGVRTRECASAGARM